MKYVVVDTDYFNFITNNLSNTDLFIKIMEVLDYTPVMHEFVYRQELHEHSKVKNLIENSKLEIYNYDSLTSSKKEKKEYDRIFRYSYKELNGKEFDNSKSVKEYHHEKENLGEIHSVIMAKLNGYDLMMSNDGPAKFFIENKLNSSKNQIHVVNIEKTFNLLISPDNGSIKWSDIKGVLSKYKNSVSAKDKDKYDRIHEIWVGNSKENKK